MNCQRLLSIVCFLSATFAFAATASAQSDGGQSNANKTRVDLSVGIKGGAAMSAVTEVPNLTPEQWTRYGARDDASGFFGAFGVGPAFGLALEARAWEVLGLETGFYYSLDHATGWLDKEHSQSNTNLGRIYSEQETTALHIPLLLKVNANTEMIKPFFGLGFEFVLQQDSELSYRTDDAAVEGFEAEYERRNRIEPSDYTLLQLTAGIEIDLGNIRIPVEIRAGYNLGWDDTFDARVDPRQQDDGSWLLFYNGEYLGNFGFFTGVMYDWDLMI